MLVEVMLSLTPPHGPMDYDSGWRRLALLALVAAVVLPLLVWGVPRLLRGRGAPTQDQVEVLRADALARVESVRTQAAAGLLDSRAAHQHLSLIVREFVATCGPVDVDHLSEWELRQHQQRHARLAPVVRFVERCRAPGFAPGETLGAEVDVRESIDQAGEVIRSW